MGFMIYYIILKLKNKGNKDAKKRKNGESQKSQK